MNAKEEADSSSQMLRIKVLKDEQIEQINELSLTLLEQTGIIVHYPPARELLARHGATVDDARQLVRIPRTLVHRALEAAPRQVLMHSQNDPKKDCLLAVNGGQYARPSTGLDWIIDYQSKHRRPVEAQDVVNWTRVADALPNIHIVGSLYDQESAVQSMEVRCLARLLHHTEKPLMFSMWSGEGMRWLHRISEVTQSPERQPRLMVLSSSNSPLIYGWGQCEAAMASAEVGIPVLFDSSAVAGVTGPATLAGNVAQINAEMLAMLTILQLHRPGALAVYAAHPMVLDMRTGMPSISAGEVGLMSAACVQIGRWYGLPTACNGIATDSCYPDSIATTEKWASGYLPAMAGANVNAGAGSLACVGTVSLEQLVIDSDIYGHIFRHARGIRVDEDTLAGDVIASVGAGGAYLLHDHTLSHHRAEYYYSPLANRLSASAWEAAGSRSGLERAHDEVQKILSREPRQYITEEQSREIANLLARAQEALANIEVPA